MLVSPQARPRRWLLTTLVFCVVGLAALAPPQSASAAARPTIVLVHGAFADASSWSQETQRLQRLGYRVVVPANPLRGVTYDAAYIRSVLTAITGPIVLVGHSYGGAVITNAATGNPNVKALVYVAAFAPDTGESLASLGAQHPGGQIGPATLDIRPYPMPDGSQSAEGTIKTDAFRRIFAADVPAATARVMAASQRPSATATLTDASADPAWKTIPSWFLVAGRDLAIGTDLEQFEADRMGATTTLAKGASHAVLVSDPALTTKVILAAATSV